MKQKITENDLLDAMAAGMKISEISKKFKVSRQCVYQKLNRMRVSPPVKEKVGRLFVLNRNIIAMITGLAEQDGKQAAEIIEDAVDRLYFDGI